MLYFIPAWYQQNKWCENEQYWHRRRARSEFDDTVKHIQLFHRSGAYPFQVMLLSFAPNFRHFLHRQSIFRIPYWSCFDAIQEVKRRKVRTFSFHNINWPKNIEFLYTPFVLIAQLHGIKYAEVEFGEDGNLIQIDMYQDGRINRRNIYDDRGFVSSTIIFENAVPVYQDYLTDKGVWKIREYLKDGHVEVNPKYPTYRLEYEQKEDIREFKALTYPSIEQVIEEVFAAYVSLLKEDDLFCIAMHERHTDVMKHVLEGKKKILSFFDERYYIKEHLDDMKFIEDANYLVTDSQENLRRIKKHTLAHQNSSIDITPFDSRADFGISQQLNVQKILVPVDGIMDDCFEEIIQKLGEYLPTNENARVHLFTRVADYNRKKYLLEKTRQILRNAGMEEEWAAEETKGKAENALDVADAIPVKFFVEQCVDELAVSKCIREQRVILDMRRNIEIYLQITGISMGVPQIVSCDTPFVEHEKNGLILNSTEDIPNALAFYLEDLANWNEAMVYSYEIGKKYTTGVLIEKWKEVIDFVGHDSSASVRK